MTMPFISELRLFPWNWAVRGWAVCQGQTLSIQQNQAMFALIGTTYGGNGQSTFQLPDLRGRAAIGWGQGPGLSNYSVGQVGGAETVTLLQTEIPQHTHLWVASSAPATQNPPVNAYLAKINRTNIGELNGYAAPGGSTVALGNVAGTTAGAQPHNNMQPSLVMNYCIALQGIFPSRN